MDREIVERMMKAFECLNKMLELTFEGFRKYQEKSINEAEEIRREVQRYASELTRFLVEKSLSKDGGKEWVKPYIAIVSSFDRMVYNLDGILDRLRKMVHEQVLFTERAIREIDDVFQETIRLIGNVPDLILTQNKLLAQQMEEKGKSILRMADHYSEEHEQRLIEGVCVPYSSPLYLDILFSLKGIVAQTVEMSERIVALSAKV